MRKEKEVATRRVGAQTIQNYLSKLGDLIIGGQEKVWVTKDPNGTMNFFVGRNKVCISVPEEMKGGMA